MVKILHTADFHIGANFSSFSDEIAEKMAELQIYAVIDMVKVANSNFIDIMLIAGDLFDSHTVSMSLKTKILDLLSNFNGKIFLVCGNHDYYFKGSFWDKIQMPKNIFLFRNNTFSKYETDNFCVHGASFNDTYDDIDLNTLVVNPEKLNIGIVHSDILTKSKYNSLKAEDIARTNLDYLALGHNHSFSDVKQAENTIFACPGCISATGKDESGPKGYIICELTKESKNITFIKSVGATILEKSIDVTNIKTNEELSSEIAKYASNSLYLEVILDGVLDFEIDAKQLQNANFNQFLYLNIIDMTTTKKDLWRYYYDESLIGEFTRIMHQKYSENPSPKILEALKIGLDSLIN